MTTVSYYTVNNKSPVKEFIESLSIRQIRKITHLFRAIQIYGLTAAVPHIRKLANTPFYEFRILGTDNIRLFYIREKIDTIIILHGCVKKSKKTAMNDLQTVFHAYYNLQNQS